MSGYEVIAVCGGGVATALATYVGLVVRPLEKDLQAAQDQRGEDKENAEKLRAEDRALTQARIDALHADKKDLENRMTSLERTALTRSEMDTMRRDMESAVERMGERVMKHFDETSTRLEKRIERVEASRG